MAFFYAQVAMVSIFHLFIVISFPSIVSSYSFSKLTLPSPAMGPDSTAFDSLGGGPYTGVADGRTLKYQGPTTGFQDYAYNSPNRSKAVCDGNSNPALGNICGRPLGLGFQYSTGELFIADAYIGLVVVGAGGGLARPLANGAEGVPFGLLDGLEVQPLTELVFLTDASAVFSLSEIELAVAANDSTGRLLKYDPTTSNITVLLRNLSGPAGVAVSADGTYLLFTEFIGQRIQKYWLRGPKANTSEVLLSLPGRPDNIKRTPLGDYWVALNVQQSSTNQTTNVPTALRINGSGTVLQNISLSEQYNTTMISEVNEHLGLLYISSMYVNFIGVLKF